MFTIFATNTIAWDYQVQGNFEYVGSGDRLPSDGVSLTAIDKTYDLGSEAYQWKSVHANTIDYDYINDTKQLLVDQAVSIGSFATDIKIDGINGDAYSFFEISMFCEHTYSNQSSETAYANIMLYYNDITTTVNFSSKWIHYAAFPGSATTQGGQPGFGGMVLGRISASTTYWGGNANISLKTGTNKKGFSYFKDSRNMAGLVSFTENTITSDTVTSLYFYYLSSGYSFTYTSIHIQLWGVK